MFCHKCGKENGDTRFCIFCGAELPRLPKEPAVEPPPLAKPEASVVDEPAPAQLPVTPPEAPVMGEPVVEQPPIAPPDMPVMGEPVVEQPPIAPPDMPAMGEPVMEQPSEGQPEEPAMSEPPMVLPTDGAMEPYGSEPPVTPFAYNQPPYMGEPPLVQMMSMQPQAPPRKKKKTGLIIGIIAAVLAVLAGAAVLLFYMLTFPVEGQWYNEDRGEVLVFGEDGSVEVISLMGTEKGDFEYNRLKGEGYYSVGKASFDFESDEEEAYVDGLGTYVKADEGFSTEDFLADFGWLGTWYSEERGEVLVFGTKGALQHISLVNTKDTLYEYNYLDGSGTLTLDDVSHDVSIKNSQLNISDIGAFKPAESAFDSAAFIDEFGQLGTWYCEERGEVLVFSMEDGTVKSRHASATNDATFEFTPSTNAVALTVGPFTYQGKIEDGQLVTDNMGTFVQADDNFNESAFFEDFGNSVLGIWYDKMGELVVDLHDDGTYDAISYGSAFTGEYTKRDNGATIYFDLSGIDFKEVYNLVSGELVKTDKQIADAADAMVRGATDQFGEEDFYKDIMGVWTPLYGSGTVNFSDTTHVILKAGGSTYNGTYTYDPLIGAGIITIQGDTAVFATGGDYLYFLDIIFVKVS